MTMCWNVLTLRSSEIRMSLFLHQIWRNVSLHHCLSNGCSAVNGCRQNESPRILAKNILMMDLFQLLSSQDVNWWTGVVWITCGLLWCFYQQFGLSFWRHPFTAEDPLRRHWCNATFLQIWWRNKLILILHGLRVSTFQDIFIFGWTIPFCPHWQIFVLVLSINSLHFTESKTSYLTSFCILS